MTMHIKNNSNYWRMEAKHWWKELGVTQPWNLPKRLWLRHKINDALRRKREIEKQIEKDCAAEADYYKTNVNTAYEGTDTRRD